MTFFPERFAIVLALVSFTPAAFAAAPAHKWANEQWRDTAEKVIVQRMADFEKAQDKNEFCPGYAQASQAAKINCWSILVRATVKLESGDNPKNTYYEPMGYNSVGLLQLSRGECKNAPSEAALKNGDANLICGVNKMANLVRNGKRVEGKQGAGKYWSVLRKPYRYGGMSLGKVNQIQAVTKKYQDFTPGKVALALGAAATPVADNPALSGNTAPPAPPASPTPAPVRPEPAVLAQDEAPAAEPAPVEEPAPKPRKKATTASTSRRPADTGSRRAREREDEGDWAQNFWKNYERNGGGG